MRREHATADSYPRTGRWTDDAPGGLYEGGSRLWRSLMAQDDALASEDNPARDVALEACRAKDRCDILDGICRDEPVRDHEDAGACDTDRFGALFRHLLQAGIYVPPSQFECLFPSTSHTDDDVERSVAAVEAFAETFAT